MIELAQLARKYRDDFNRGWNIMKDVGIMNEAVAAEIEVLHMLRRSGGVIRSWDAMLEVYPQAPVVCVCAALSDAFARRGWTRCRAFACCGGARRRARPLGPPWARSL